MVCTDGSDASKLAINFVKDGLFREDKDHFEIAHAWSKDKEEYLKFNMKRDFINQMCNADFLYLGKKFHYTEEEIKDEKTAKEVLTEIIADRKADMNVVGFHGRKGPKGDPTVMGTAV